MERYLAVAYWAGRKEEPSACAMRASRFLFHLSKFSADMTGWRERGKSRKEALDNQIYQEHALNDLERLFAKGVSKRDFSGTPNHNLGFSASLWNGKDENHAATLNIRCGLYSTVQTLGNAVVLNLPHDFDVTIKEELKQLALAFIEAWEPDWMAITSQTKMNECGTQKPFLDRLLFIKSNGSFPTLSLKGIEEKLDQGTIFLNMIDK